MNVEDFCRKFGMPTPAEPTIHDVGLAQFRLGLMYEELIEYELALDLALTATTPSELDSHFEDMLDALGDLIYAAAGTAIIHGFDIRAALREIHRANMDKEVGIGKRGHACDVIKPPGWKPPKHNIRKRTTIAGDLFEEPEQLKLPGL
jgi:predicted HAD superfamily Cof-like phosphohydrolase